MHGETAQYGLKLHAMSIEERERMLFSFGWECLVDAKTELVNGTNETIWLRHADIFPNCAMLHVLAMIENMDGTINTVYPAPYIFNFYLSGTDDNNTFQKLAHRIPLFYPWVTIGTVALKKNTVAPEEKYMSGDSGEKGVRQGDNPGVTKKFQGVRVVFLVLAIIFGSGTLAGLILLFSDPNAGLGLTIGYGPLFALFLWLYLRKKKEPQSNKRRNLSRERYSLDSTNLFFLSVFKDENNKLAKYSIDVEKANDSHYELNFLSGYKIYKILRAKGFDKAARQATPDQRLVSALTAFISKGNGGAAITGLLDKNQIKYYPYHF